MANSHANDLLYLDGLIEQLRKRAENVNTFWLKSIGKRIRELKKMDPSDAAGIAAIRNDTSLIADILDAVQSVGNDTVDDAKTLLRTAARLSMEASPVAQGLALDSWISGVAEATQGRLQNIANTTVVGVLSPDGFRTPQEAYIRAIDEVAAQIASGELGLKAGVRRVLKQLADSGLSVVEYESGRTRSLAASIEMNLKEATSQVYQGVQRRVGEEFGADGFEISAHWDCAPDHLDVQGRQYTMKEYEKLNAGLSRPIGTLNCRHTIYSIIIGVSEPTYSNVELAAMKDASLRKTEFDGKEMTNYEASQMQRRLEREIRKQKNRSVIAKAAGDDEMRREAQMKINQLTGKYKELSDKFGLPTKSERMAVSGYRPVNVPKSLLQKTSSTRKITDLENAWLYKEKLSNIEVRKLYKSAIENIPNIVAANKSVPLEQQARKACEMRTIFREKARDIMADVEKRKQLDLTAPEKSFEELLEYKKQKYGLTGDDAYRDIIRSAGTTNKNVDQMFGLQ